MFLSDQFLACGKQGSIAHELASQIWLAVIDNLDDSEKTFHLLMRIVEEWEVIFHLFFVLTIHWFSQLSSSFFFLILILLFGLKLPSCSFLLFSTLLKFAIFWSIICNFLFILYLELRFQIFGFNCRYFFHIHIPNPMWCSGNSSRDSLLISVIVLVS